MFFINRKNELSLLENLYSADGATFFLLYGRRRVGKTYLLKKFIDNKEGYYLLSKKRNIRSNINNFCDALERNGLPNIRVENFIEFFGKYRQYLENKVLIIDEFQYLIESDTQILGDFQYIFDEIFENDFPIFIILCGSSMGMLEGLSHNRQSPLYGRFTGRLKLPVMSFQDISLLHKDQTLQTMIHYFGAVGGIAQYNLYFKENRDFFENVSNTFFNPGHYLYNEGEFLLRQELRDIATYMTILQAMANGKTRVTEIANAAYIPAKDLPKYMTILINLDLVRRITPIDAKPTGKRSIYVIADNYLRFWFKFVAPFKSHIEFYNTEPAMTFLKKNLATYTGYIVENIVEEYFKHRVSRVGKWWYKDSEIDLVAIDEIKKEVIFIEVKWTNKTVSPKICRDLINKCNLVKGLDGYSKKFIIIAKQKRKLEGCQVITLQELLNL